MYGGSRKVGTCPQEQIGPKPQVPTLISEAKVGTWSETRQRESWNLYCRERGTAITTTAPVLQRKRNYNCYDRSSIANSKKLQSLRPLHYCKERGTAITTTVPMQRERETAIIATLSNIAEREKPELLGPLQYCRDRNCNCCDYSSMAEREIAINYYDRSSIAERYVYGDPTTISLVSGMTPWIVEGPESHTRALTPPHASVYRRVCVGSNPPSQPAPRPPQFIGLGSMRRNTMHPLHFAGRDQYQPASPLCSVIARL